MLLYKLRISNFHVWVTVTINTYLDAPLHFSFLYPTHAPSADFSLKIRTFILKL